MIVSSTITWDNIQIDGRHSVRETWLDDVGNVFTYDYLANAGSDINATMIARTPQVEAQSEALQNPGDGL